MNMQVQLTAASPLMAIQQGVVLVKDLLVAADHILPRDAAADLGPLQAVLRAAISEARNLDALVDDAFESDRNGSSQNSEVIRAVRERMERQTATETDQQ